MISPLWKTLCQAFLKISTMHIFHFQVFNQYLGKGCWKTHIHLKTCTQMLIAYLFATANNGNKWKQNRFMNKQIMICLYCGVLCSNKMKWPIYTYNMNKLFKYLCLNRARLYDPCKSMSSACILLWKNYIQRICLIREVRTCRNKGKQSKETNNNNVVKHSHC